MLDEELREAEEDLATLRRRDEAPVRERLLRGRDRAVDVLRAERGNVPINSPSAGLVESKVSPEAASIHSPPM